MAESGASKTSDASSGMVQSKMVESAANGDQKDKNLERFIIFPIEHQSIYQLYERAKQSFWVAEEVDFKQDRDDFETFKPAEQKIIKNVYALFACSDAIVNDNIISYFMEATPFRESQLFYGFQMAMEVEHQVTYAKGIMETIRDRTEQKQLFQAVLSNPGIRRMSQWYVDYVKDTTKSFIERLVASVITEGVFFQGAFAIIFWIKETYPGKMPGLVFSNDLISADETMHADHTVLQFLLLIHHQLKEKLPQDQVHGMFESAMDMERFFVDQFMDEGVFGLSKKELIEHLEYICDFWLGELSYEKRFKTKNPFQFMEKISMRGRTNFFERRNREYRRAKSSNTNIQSNSFVDKMLDF